MSDPTGPTNDQTEPIVVHGTPTPDQLSATVRTVLIAAGVVATTLGATHLGGEINGLLQFAGPIATAIGYGLALLKARSSAQKMTAMAHALPDSFAKVKKP